ncbi:MAG: TM2 domain-containing protein [Deltaproteobacteria bacterium]|nr:TM2 domain-containing protein [Deltaproteobacteria bacterium]MBW2413034.1 TM2 domain-containing protein [Deltaproteobacteria bacterium]
MQPVQSMGQLGYETASPKSYTTAVVLSSVLGWMGAQHFYLGRWAEGFLDLGLTLGFVSAFLTGHPFWGMGLLAVDLAHEGFVTIALLTGNFRDGDGLRVMYPGQRPAPQPDTGVW